MPTATIEYLGGLRTKCKHSKSGVEIVTDAPVDNNGRGESFSPTDMLATSYVSCMLTIIGIYCDKNGLEFTTANAEMNKVMGSGPRRVERIEIFMDLSGNNWTEDQKEKIIQAAEACPVAKSVNDDMEIEIEYQF
jgi:uncharacterized OsmC-like protein